MENQLWAVDCGLGWTVGKKGLGHLCSKAYPFIREVRVRYFLNI